MNHAHPVLPRHRRRRHFVPILALLLALSGTAAGDGTQPAPAQPDLSGLHPIAQAIAQAGAPQCAPRVHEAVVYLILNTESGAMMHAQSEDLYSFSLEVTDDDGLTYYVSLNVAPGNDAACAISYEIVTPLALDCEAIAKQLWPNAVVGNPLRKHMTPLAVGDGQTVLLHPIGDGCLVIRKEIIP
jgi:hypothetical protein